MQGSPLPPGNGCGLLAEASSDQQGIMSSLGQSDLHALVCDLDLGAGVEEMAKDLAGFGGFVARQELGQHPIQPGGDFGQRHVEVDLHTYAELKASR